MYEGEAEGEKGVEKTRQAGRQTGRACVRHPSLYMSPSSSLQQESFGGADARNVWTRDTHTHTHMRLCVGTANDMRGEYRRGRWMMSVAAMVVVRVGEPKVNR